MSLKHAVLGLLHLKPRSGYDLAKAMEKTTAFFWKAGHSQIYPELKRLSATGMVEVEHIIQEGKPSKQVYHVTDRGKEALTRWLIEPTGETFIRDEFMLQVFFSSLLSKQEILEKIKNQRELHLRRLNEYRAFAVRYENLNERNIHTYLSLRRGVLLEEEWLKWCDEAETLIKKLRVD